MKGRIVDKGHHAFDVEIDSESIEVGSKRIKAPIGSAKIDRWLGGVFKLNNGPNSIRRPDLFALLIIDDGKYYFGKCGAADPIYNKYLFGITKLQISEQLPSDDDLFSELQKM